MDSVGIQIMEGELFSRFLCSLRHKEGQWTHRAQRRGSSYQNRHRFHQMIVILCIIQVQTVEPWARLTQLDQGFQIDTAMLFHALTKHDELRMRCLAAAQIQIGNVKRFDYL